MSEKIRAKIGLISPVESLTELAFHKYAPDGVDIRTTRIQMKDKNPQSLFRFCDMMEEAAKVFDGYPQDIVIFGCAGATCIGEKDWDKQCGERIRRACGSPGTTTTTATLEAFETLNVKRFALLAPYPPEVTDIEIRYFGYYGYSVAARKRLTAGSDENLSVDKVYEQAAAMELGNSDALLISCMALDTMEAIQPLEDRFGIPVVTSHQASLWSVLRAAGIKEPLSGLGKLFTL